MSRSDPLARPEALIRRVYSYVAYLVGDGHEAEDLTSETIERALRYRQSYDPTKGTPTTWVLGIARRVVAAPRHAALPLTDEVADRIDADVDALIIERLAVRSAVARLPERDRELIALRYGADLTARGIAELLGERTNAIEVALHRALGRLRLELEDENLGRRQRASHGGHVAPDSPNP